VKIATYAVSVQWGNGHHYFLKFTDDEAEAIAMTRGIQERQQRTHKTAGRGAKPRTHLWKHWLTVE